MTIPVKQMLVSSQNYKIKCPNTMLAEYITFHNTANDASALNEIRYMCNNTDEKSFHFAVDDKEVIQGIPLDRNAWHCGDSNGTGNRKSIGVEVCYSKSGGERYEKAEALAIKFIAQILHERKWGIDRVKPHQHWSGKNCPHRILDEGRWKQVLNTINEELKRLNTSTPGKHSFFFTGGYQGQELVTVHSFLVSNGYGFNPVRHAKGYLMFDIGGFVEGSAAEGKMENFLKQNKFAYEKRVL